ncbi:MAG: hypothetical protein JSS89_10950 [Bacteroidetes bacterium]|nr:hypothetical protein [Bacteroidota bacterium]
MPIRDYIIVTRKGELIADLAVPVVVAIVTTYGIDCSGMCANESMIPTITNWLTNIITACSILTGFDTTALIVMLTGDTNSLIKLLEGRSAHKRILKNEKINLKQLLTISLSHSIVVQLALITADAFVLILSGFLLANQWLMLLTVFLNVLIFVHIIVVNSRIVVNVYQTTMHPTEE